MYMHHRLSDTNFVAQAQTILIYTNQKHPNISNLFTGLSLCVMWVFCVLSIGNCACFYIYYQIFMAGGVCQSDIKRMLSSEGIYRWFDFNIATSLWLLINISISILNKTSILLMFLKTTRVTVKHRTSSFVIFLLFIYITSSCSLVIVLVYLSNVKPCCLRVTYTWGVSWCMS